MAVRIPTEGSTFEVAGVKFEVKSVKGFGFRATGKINKGDVFPAELMNSKSKFSLHGVQYTISLSTFRDQTVNISCRTASR